MPLLLRLHPDLGRLVLLPMAMGQVSSIILTALNLKGRVLNDGLSASGKIFSAKGWFHPAEAGSHCGFHKVSLAQVNMAFKIIKGKNKNLSAFIKSSPGLHTRMCINQHSVERWLASRLS